MIVLPVFDPDLIVIAGFLHIKWYGFMYVLGFLCAWFLARNRLVEIGLTTERMLDYLTYVAMGIVVGGRLGYMLIYQWSSMLESPWVVFEIWRGGMAFHGALMGGLVAAWLFATRHEIALSKLLDFTVPLIPPGLFWGRLGNFINGELWGRVSTLSWAMVFPHSDGLPRHPSQLYAMFGEGVLLFFLLEYNRKKTSEVPGSLGMKFLFYYGVVRFFLEFFREPDPQLGFVLLGLTMGQCLCLLMVAIALLWHWLQHMQLRHPTLLRG
jgi:phosphatidylglycerol:prolipoprotein diacylglycerol transferase